MHDSGSFLHYFWLVSLAFAIAMLVVSLGLVKLLKVEYQMFVGDVNIFRLNKIRNGFRLKEVKYLLMKLIVAKAFFYFLLLTTIILFSISYFF